MAQPVLAGFLNDLKCMHEGMEASYSFTSSRLSDSEEHDEWNDLGSGLGLDWLFLEKLLFGFLNLLVRFQRRSAK